MALKRSISGKKRRSMYRGISPNPTKRHLLFQRKRFDKIADALQIQRQEQWYSVTNKQLNRIDANKYLAPYKYSLLTALRTLYPEFEWNPFYFVSSQTSYWSSPENLRKAFDWVAEKCGVQTFEDWYHINETEVRHHLGLQFMKDKKVPLETAIQAAYKEFDWNPLLFAFGKHRLLPSKNLNHRVMMDIIADKLQINQQQDWYGVTTRQLLQHGGKTVVEYYRYSLYRLMRHVYPEFEWNPFEFHTIPHNFLSDSSNRRKFLDWFAERIGIEQQADWYYITGEIFRSNGGSVLLSMYNDSLYDMLQSMYPEFEWNPLLFVKRFQMQDKKTHREVLDNIAEILGVETQSDWYKVEIRDIRAIKESLVNFYYNGSFSLLSMLQDNYPEFEWNPLLFPSVPDGHWDHPEITRKSLTWIGEQLGVEKQEDWYKVKRTDVVRYGADGLLAHEVNSSMVKTLQKVFPEYDWYPWLSVYMPKRYWNSPENQKQCLDWVGEQLNIKDPKEWIYTTRQMVEHLGGRNLLNHFKGVFYRMITTCYPQLNYTKFYSDGQLTLFNQLNEMFDTKILLEYKYTGYGNTSIEFDVYLPELQLALEYQGPMHYHEDFFQGHTEERTQRFKLKKQVCDEKGITILQVPYWWKKGPASLISTILSVRPDVAKLIQWDNLIKMP